MCCDNRTASAQAYDLVAKTYKTYAQGDTLQATRDRPNDVVSRTNRADSPGQPRKRDLPTMICVNPEQLRCKLLETKGIYSKLILELAMTKTFE